MKYKVILPFSHKFNGVRREVKIGDIVSDKEINPSILKYVLDNEKIKSLEKKRKVGKKVVKEELIGKKKVKRMSKEETAASERTEDMPRTGLIDFNRESLGKMSKSELKRIATQVGIGVSGTKEILVNKILKSGI